MSDDWITAFADRLLTADLAERNNMLTSDEGLRFVETVYVENMVAAYDGDADDVRYPSALSPAAAFGVMYALLTNPHLRLKLEVAYFDLHDAHLAKEPPRRSDEHPGWDQKRRRLNTDFGVLNDRRAGRPKGSKNRQ